MFEFGQPPLSFNYNSANYGVDWRSVAFSTNGAAFASNGFVVDPIGNISSGNLTLNGILNAATTHVSSVTIIDGGVYTTVPTLIIQAPAAGGTTATATVGSMVAVNQGAVSISSGGSGYLTGDIVTLSGGTGTPPSYTVTASGGVVTSIALNSAGNLGSLPTFPATFSGGTGSGFTATVGFAIGSLNVTSGAGYSPGVVPLVIATTSSFYASKLLAIMANQITRTLVLNSLGGDVQIGPNLALSPSSTTGFLKLPFMSGSPTATPANSGPSLIWNDTTKVLNIYSPSAGAWFHISASSGPG